MQKKLKLNTPNSSIGKQFMEKIIHSGKVSELTIKGKDTLYLDMPRNPEEAQMSFPLQGAFGILTTEEIFKPYLGKDISITFEKKEGKIHNIIIQEE